MSGEVHKEASGTDWAAWPTRSPEDAFTLGVEEELMLLSPGGWNLAQAADEVLPRLPEAIRSRVCPETHAAALEIETGVARTVADATRELRGLRDGLRETVEPLDLAVASSGTHPFAVWRETALGGGERQAEVYGSMRELARREPTYALHVHVGMPDQDAAVAVFNRMRVHLPLLLALSGNSPFWQGRDTGLASARTPLFQAFPRVGIPRRFDDYAEWVGAVDMLVACDAFPDSSYLWWDVRMVPRHGTLEVRIMDAQIDLDATASLVALTQCLARMELEEAWAEEASHAPQEVWEENRFVAARDGIDARLIVVTEGVRVPVADRVDELLPRLRPHAQDLGCADELEGILDLVRENGAKRQLEIARDEDRLPGLVQALAGAY
ncbi:carboxylate-amine ligase [Patulibacter americanus]|uniref:carboxylate-amine ligase n=1 Tax=Patulibacter americanus TaxID=588672 RepID=UPI0003B3B1D9|nr:YbdK family carboxylate-amine ligase [Patulibacter americanus]